MRSSRLDALHRRGWTPTTSGNFSAGVDHDLIAVTRSGVDKGALKAADVLIQPLDRPLLSGSSAEAALHARRYRDAPETDALSYPRAHLTEGVVWIEGWELQKALTGVKSARPQSKRPSSLMTGMSACSRSGGPRVSRRRPRPASSGRAAI